MKNLIKFFKAAGNVLMLPVIVLFKFRNLLIFAVMIINLWYSLPNLLGWLILINIFLHAYSIFAMRTRNKNYKNAAIQTHILNSKIGTLEELKMQELEKLHELEKDA